MIGMGQRPGSHLLQGVDQRGRRGSEVDVRDVKDLHAGPQEPAAFGRVGTSVFPEPLQDLPRTWLGIAASLGVVKNVELDLPDSPDRELLGECRV